MMTSKRQKSVFVVCDEGSELKIISSLMEKLDFHVLTIPDKAASVDGFVQHGEVIDLAIIDADKMGVNGAAMLHFLYESYPQLRLVFMSSDPDWSGTEVGSTGHICRYLRKPARKAQLLGTILAVMDAPSMLAA